MRLCVVFLFVWLRLAAADPASWPGEQWPTANPAELGLAEKKLGEARDYALTGEGSGCIIVRGRLVMSWGDQDQLYDLKSSSKSIGVTLLGLALQDGRVTLDDPARKHHPQFGVPPESNAGTGWLDAITLRRLANQTAGFDKPGGYEPLLFAPGTQWHYSDGGPNWLAECLSLVYRRDLNEVLFERVLIPIGVRTNDLRWRRHAYRPEFIDGIPRREFGSGFSANMRALARIGYLYLREGQWNGKHILPPEFVAAVRQPGAGLAGLPVRDPKNYGRASAHYGLLWWNNADGAIAGLPRDAYWSWGLFDSLMVVVPSLDLVAARAGKSWKRAENADHYDVLKPFLEPIAAAFKKRASALSTEPQRRAGADPLSEADPPSPVIHRIVWAPTNEILRLAQGSDNWPMTWADDDALYTAYGDGRGFEPFAPEKLSMGLAKVLGSPPDITGINLRSSTAEATGDGRQGRKASGLLMVDGVLYLLVRNAGNAQLGWSADHALTWRWAPWKFTNSFACPAFLNFGRNYAGARDDFVYLYSHDSDSAYDRADRMVLARVPKTKLRDRDAYEFLVKLDEGGHPVWTKDINQRGAVFTHPGRCYRSSISYNAALKRYLWCQTGAGADTRFAGGFAIYDATEPWGPWTTVFQVDQWDVGPGETCHLPAKWMGENGRTVYLVFSGDDCFSVRKAILEVAP